MFWCFALLRTSFLDLRPLWLLLSAMALAPGFAHAQDSVRLNQVAHQWLRQAVASAQLLDARIVRTETSVGEMDARLKLAPCAKVDAYLPAGAQLWGNTRVGLRCSDGLVRWNITVPASVRAFGLAWVVKGNVPAGTVLTEADVIETEVDWAQDPSPVLKERSFWLGQVATRPLTTGQALRQGMVRAAQVFQAGAQVRVVAQGVGFQISGDALALSAGMVGQTARVRMDNGRVASGTVLDARTVRVDL